MRETTLPLFWGAFIVLMSLASCDLNLNLCAPDSSGVHGQFEQIDGSVTGNRFYPAYQISSSVPQNYRWHSSRNGELIMFNGAFFQVDTLTGDAEFLQSRAYHSPVDVSPSGIHSVELQNRNGILFSSNGQDTLTQGIIRTQISFYDIFENNYEVVFELNAENLADTAWKNYEFGDVQLLADEDTFYATLRTTTSPAPGETGTARKTIRSLIRGAISDSMYTVVRAIESLNSHLIASPARNHILLTETDQISLIETQTGSITAMPSGYYPRWGNSNEAFAFSSLDNTLDVYDLRTADTTKIADQAWRLGGYSLDNSGTYILLSKPDDSIWAEEIMGTQSQLLVPAVDQRNVIHQVPFFTLNTTQIIFLRGESWFHDGCPD